MSKDHPLRTIKAVADEALQRLSSEFDRMYSKVGRALLPPERLLKASLLISLNSVRSERAFCEIQSAVSLVPAHEPYGAELRPHGVHQEPETFAGTQDGTAAAETAEALAGVERESRAQAEVRVRELEVQLPRMQDS